MSETSDASGIYRETASAPKPSSDTANAAPQAVQTIEDLVGRLRSNEPLPLCPYDRRSPLYWTTPDDKPCPFCGTENKPDAPDLCRGADTRLFSEAASAIEERDREIERLKIALSEALRRLAGRQVFIDEYTKATKADIDALENSNRLNYERALSAERQLSEVREGLRPLADCEIIETDPPLLDSDIGRYPFTMGEIRAARALLGTSGAESAAQRNPIALAPREADSKLEGGN